MKYSLAVLALLLCACGPSNTPQSSDAGAKSAAGAGAGSSSCSATNAAGKGCKVSCEAGQSATCKNASGKEEPSCTCTPKK